MLYIKQYLAGSILKIGFVYFNNIYYWEQQRTHTLFRSYHSLSKHINQLRIRNSFFGIPIFLIWVNYCQKRSSWLMDIGSLEEAVL